MSLLNSVLKLFVGDKNKKDLQSLLPIIDKVDGYYKTFKSFSNDELRAKSIEFKETLIEYVTFYEFEELIKLCNSFGYPIKNENE